MFKSKNLLAFGFGLMIPVGLLISPDIIFAQRYRMILPPRPPQPPALNNMTQSQLGTGVNNQSVQSTQAAGNGNGAGIANSGSAQTSVNYQYSTAPGTQISTVFGIPMATVPGGSTVNGQGAQGGNPMLQGNNFQQAGNLAGGGGGGMGGGGMGMGGMGGMGGGGMGMGGMGGGGMGQGGGGGYFVAQDPPGSGNRFYGMAMQGILSGVSSSAFQSGGQFGGGGFGGGNMGGGGFGGGNMGGGGFGGGGFGGGNMGGGGFGGGGFGGKGGFGNGDNGL